MNSDSTDGQQTTFFTPENIYSMDTIDIADQCKIKLFKLYDDVITPVKSTDYASCFDLYAHKVIRVDEFLFKVTFGFKTQLPESMSAHVYPRSSISKTGWILANSVGIIDNDYRGEWMAYFRCVSFSPEQRKISKDFFLRPREPFPYSVGDRVAQFKLFPDIKLDNDPSKEIKEVNDESELSSTDRGSGGFGSTGK